MPPFCDLITAAINFALTIACVFLCKNCAKRGIANDASTGAGTDQTATTLALGLSLNFFDDFCWRPSIAPPNPFDYSISIDQRGREPMQNRAALRFVDKRKTRESVHRFPVFDQWRISRFVHRRDETRRAKFCDQKLLRVKGNTVVVTRSRELQKLLQRNLGEL